MQQSLKSKSKSPTDRQTETETDRQTHWPLQPYLAWEL